MNVPLPLTRALPAQPRAIGSVRLSTKLAQGRTVLDGLYQHGAARVVFPRAARGMTAVLLNTSGGVTGGDRFDYAATAGPGTHLTITTQACERAYRAQEHEVGRLETRLAVQDNATLWWLPQETLIFDGCAMTRRLTCDLSRTSRALIVEPLCIGRIAMGEARVQGRFSDRIHITRDGAPLVHDAWRLQGDMSAQIAQTAIGDGAGALVSLTFIAPEAEAQLDPIRAMLPETAGASLLAHDTLVLRALAPSGYHLRKTLLPILDHLTGGHLPICWRL